MLFQITIVFDFKNKSRYQDIERNNKDDENKQKLNKKASKQVSQLADWSRQAPGFNAIGGTQSQPAKPDSSEAGLGISQLNLFVTVTKIQAKVYGTKECQRAD